MTSYALGLDYGTQSARGVLVEVATGRQVAQAVRDYAHGVMDRCMPNGEPLPAGWALQHPQDYLDALEGIVKEILSVSGAKGESIVGIGVDFTNCTILPVDENGDPLCFKHEFADRRSAYVKLWKHNSSQPQAGRITDKVYEMNPEWLLRNGGRCSSEWMFPKMLQTLEEDPDIYRAAAHFVEAGDWLTWQLTGQLTRNICFAGYKAMYHHINGYPKRELWAALNPDFADVVEEKLRSEVLPVGSCAGIVTEKMAQRTGLAAGTPVAVPMSDAHVATPAAGITCAGKMLMILGTSTVHLVMDEEEHVVPGICGVVRDSMIPGFFSYEAGQCCCGDHFDWFVKSCVPAAYEKEAAERGVNLHTLLTEKASALRPGQSGLVALDWWNGNRSVLIDADLTGLIAGLTLLTKPEEIYRALIEATAYGTRRIIENFAEHGVKVDTLYAAGGIARKNPMLMQIYADVTGRDICVVDSDQTPAVGSAIYGTVAAGSARGGYDTVPEAAEAMHCAYGRTYTPDKAAQKTYDALYAEYLLLHDWFGRGGNDMMKRLKAIRRENQA